MSQYIILLCLLNVNILSNYSILISLQNFSEALCYPSTYHDAFSKILILDTLVNGVSESRERIVLNVEASAK